jgi:hypothetical protein
MVFSAVVPAPDARRLSRARVSPSLDRLASRGQLSRGSGREPGFIGPTFAELIIVRKMTEPITPKQLSAELGVSDRAIRHPLLVSSAAVRAMIPPVEIAAVILSGLSLVVAIVGTALSNKRSSEALNEARKAAASALWSGVQQAVQRFIGFDPSMEPVGDRLSDLRIATIALVDELEDWAGLDTWLDAERALGAVLGRQVMEMAKPGDTVDERLANLDPYQLWAQALSSNLRRFRAVGFDADAAAELRTIAEKNAQSVYERHGWELPPSALSGLKLKPLDS